MPIAESSRGSDRGVLILAHDFPPENQVGALRPARFAKYLPDHGFRVHVLTASRQNVPSANVCCVPDSILPVHGSLIRPLRLLRALTIRTIYPGAESESFSWLAKAAHTARKLMRRERLTCLLSTFPPLAAHLAALWVKRTNPAVWWVADFRDPLLGNPVAAGGATRWNRRIEKAIFKWADVLIANTDAVAERWRAEYPDYRNKIAYIWNGFDPEEVIVPLAIPPRGYRQLAHVGDIYGSRHPGQLLDSIKRLSRSLSQSKPFRLELIGFIDRKTVPNADILTMLEQDNWVVVKPIPLPPSDAAKVMAQADALVLIDWADHSAGLQVPSKLYVYLRIGRPILAITTRESPTDRILRQSGVPFICLYPDDPHTEVDAKVLSFLALSNEPRQPNAWFYEHFDGQRQVATLAGLLCPRDRA